MAEKDLIDMTVDELRKLAAQRGIPGRAEMRKSDLVSMLSKDRETMMGEPLEERVRRLELRLGELEAQINSIRMMNEPIG